MKLNSYLGNIEAIKISSRTMAALGIELSISDKVLTPICTGGAHNERTPINIYPSFLNK
jgi:hypothetical protein